MDGREYLLWAVAAWVGAMALVRLMASRRGELVERFRQGLAEEKRRQKKAEKAAAKRARQKAREEQERAA